MEDATFETRIKPIQGQTFDVQIRPLVTRGTERQPVRPATIWVRITVPDYEIENGAGVSETKHGPTDHAHLQLLAHQTLELAVASVWSDHDSPAKSSQKSRTAGLADLWKRLR